MLRRAPVRLSNRFTHSHYYRCLECSAVRKQWSGYEGIRDPIFLKGEKNSADFYAERRRYVEGDLDPMMACDGCGTLHNTWEKITAQEYVRSKAPARPVASASSTASAAAREA